MLPRPGGILFNEVFEGQDCEGEIIDIVFLPQIFEEKICMSSKQHHLFPEHVAEGGDPKIAGCVICT